MDDKLVHGSLFLAETGDSIAALLRGPEFGFIERVVFCADDSEVETHPAALFVRLERVGLWLKLENPIRCLLSICHYPPADRTTNPRHDTSTSPPQPPALHQTECRTFCPHPAPECIRMRGESITNCRMSQFFEPRQPRHGLPASIPEG